MKDIYEAVECQSAQLSFRLERVAQKKGYAVHFSSYTIQPEAGKFIKLFHTMVHLPRGFTASFNPEHEPRDDGKRWHFEMRRSDGITRASFVNGLNMVPRDDDWVICYGDEPFNADHMEMLFEEMQLPGPSGLALAISRLWVVRFGRMPFEISTQIEKLKNVDHMDLIYDALLDQRSRKQIDDLIANEAPLDAAPRILKYLPRE